MDQEQIIRIQMMEQEVNQLNEQLKLIDQNIVEMNDLKESLDEIDKGGNKILANLGKRIYIPVEIKDKNLIVEVGKGNFVKKTISDTKHISEDQIQKLNEAKGHIMGNLEELQSEMTTLFSELQKVQMATQPTSDKKNESIEDIAENN